MPSFSNPLFVTSILYANESGVVKEKVEEDLEKEDPSPEEAAAAIAANIKESEES